MDSFGASLNQGQPPSTPGLPGFTPASTPAQPGVSPSLTGVLAAELWVENLKELVFLIGAQGDSIYKSFLSGKRGFYLQECPEALVRRSGPGG